VSRARPAGELGLAAVAALAGALTACGPAAPEPHVRLAAWTPTGAGVATDAAVALEFSGPLDEAEARSGRRVALARGSDARALSSAIGSEAGLGPDAPVIACDVALDAGGRRLTLRPLAPLTPGAIHAVLVGPLADAGGRPVLDPEGRRRVFLTTFETARAPPGPPPRPVLTEALADATAPEAGGEYVEVWNLGPGPLELEGWRLAKRTASGFATCIATRAEGGPVGPGGVALLTGGAWDGRYDVPAGVARYACGATSLAGGLANDRAPELRLLDPSGVIQATLGEGGAAPRCPGAVERIDPEGPDAPENWACAEGTGTPGACNDATPAALCP